MRPFRTLLVGLGQIGCGYDARLPFQWNQPRSSPRILSHSRAIACHPDFELLGGIDPSEDARNRFATLYGRPTYADLVDWSSATTGYDPDIVVIAVAPQLQTAIVAKLLCLMSPRLLLLEKPVATSLVDGLALEEVCARQPGLLVAVNYIRRYLPAVQFWQKRLRAGDLGALVHGQITYGKGLLCNGSHFVNLAESWLGPLKMLRRLSAGNSCLGFDCEVSLDLQVCAHGFAPLHVRSVGDAGLRAGELDLWFQGGRLCWRNDGLAIAFWPRQSPAVGDSHAALADEPELTFTGLDHYQLTVFDSLAHYLRDPFKAPLHCSLSDAMRTLTTLSQCL